MYEARQNKEKVSRRIDGDSETMQRIELKDKRNLNTIIHPLIQRHTNIQYTTASITSNRYDNKGQPVGKPHITTVGSEMIAELDPTEPIRGSGTCACVQSDLMEDLKTIKDKTAMIKGHLLNYDLGGLAIACNLFPISSSFNTGIHSNRAEKPIKKLINQGHKVHYRVKTSGVNFIDYNTVKSTLYFTWACSIGNDALPPLGQEDYNNLVKKQESSTNDSKWSHNGRRGLPQGDETNENLNHTKIDGNYYSYDGLTRSNIKYYKG